MDSVLSVLFFVGRTSGPLGIALHLPLSVANGVQFGYFSGDLAVKGRARSGGRHDRRSARSEVSGGSKPPPY